MSGFTIKRVRNTALVTFPDGYTIPLNNTAGVGKPRRDDAELIRIATVIREKREAASA
ncbi:hypothetical protein Pan2_77 [Pseudanabaena phage Pan2]|nr:hypothetical protein Pan2_77 [Pseudanabaena phage Pan2]